MVAAIPPALCPNSDALQAFCQGAAADEVLERVAEHLRVCSTCAALLTQLDSEPDPLVIALRRAAQQSPPSDGHLLPQLQAHLEGTLPVAVTPLSLQLPCQLGKYELLELLGGGGMGVVYRARQTNLQRIVAVKVLAPRLAEVPGVVRRFQEEIRLVGSLGLRQPHLVMGLDADIVEGRALLVMEFIEGIDLARLVRSVGPLSVAAVGEIGYQAAQGLVSLHELGLVHRDIKPSNMMLADGVVRLLDFGLARVAGGRLDVSDFTATHDFLGTADYVSPEQIEAPRRVDARADVYSLGCTLFFLLTGRAPFDRRQSRAEKFRAHRHEAPPDIRLLRPDVPQELADVILRMLEKNPESRFVHPADVVRSLESYVGRGELREVANLLSPRPARRTGTEPTEDLHHPSVQPAIPATPARRSPIGLLAASAAIVVVAASAFSYFSWSGTLPADPAPVNSTPVVETAPIVEPRSLLISNAAGSNFFQVNEAANKLHLVANDLNLVKLGTLDRDDALIEIAIEVSELKSESGHAGFFVGYRENGDRGRTQFQALRIETAATGEPYSRRSMSHFDPRSPESRGSRLYSSVIIKNAQRVNTLKLKLVAGKLTQFSWNDQPFQNLDPTLADEITGGDVRGAYGVYADNAVAVFSSYHHNGILREFKQAP